MIIIGYLFNPHWTQVHAHRWPGNIWTNTLSSWYTFINISISFSANPWLFSEFCVCILYHTMYQVPEHAETYSRYHKLISFHNDRLAQLDLWHKQIDLIHQSTGVDSGYRKQQKSWDSVKIWGRYPCCKCGGPTLQCKTQLVCTKPVVHALHWITSRDISTISPLILHEIPWFLSHFSLSVPVLHILSLVCALQHCV